MGVWIRVLHNEQKLSCSEIGNIDDFVRVRTTPENRNVSVPQDNADINVQITGEIGQSGIQAFRCGDDFEGISNIIVGSHRGP